MDPGRDGRRPLHGIGQPCIEDLSGLAGAAGNEQAIAVTAQSPDANTVGALANTAEKSSEWVRWKSGTSPEIEVADAVDDEREAGVGMIFSLNQNPISG
jgi:hypothetical protein